jgi:hypothetical protein
MEKNDRDVRNGIREDLINWNAARILRNNQESFHKQGEAEVFHDTSPDEEWAGNYKM